MPLKGTILIPQMRVVVSPFTASLLSKLDMRSPSFWVKGVMLEHGELDTFLEEGIGPKEHMNTQRRQTVNKERSRPFSVLEAEPIP